ncbi:SH3 domain-containing protein [Geomonas edaphica]|uniref:SH3 domain-containing protein n=1 Tax=Geomonas edaphica TaxID=2570226 RepID=UPI001FE289B4|nr:SH3 domain-containing protein [Geomonas edaphica]
MRHLLLGALLLALTAGAAAGAPPALRPYSGSGVLMVQDAPGREPGTVPLYREPGVERLTELAPFSLPHLFGAPDSALVAVYERRRGWSRVALDDAGRQGWVQDDRSWRYIAWREFLPGRSVRVLPGMKKEWYQVKSAPGAAGSAAGAVARDQRVRILEVEEAWARLENPAGWMRWRDPDGRLTVATELAR